MEGRRAVKIAATFLILMLLVVVVITLVRPGSFGVAFFGPNISRFGCRSDEPSFNRTTMTYSELASNLTEATAVCHEYGLIDITIGYNPCTIWFYKLPNGTSVNIYLGTPRGAKTCE
jgi:hypothetical protein